MLIKSPILNRSSMCIVKTATWSVLVGSKDLVGGEWRNSNRGGAEVSIASFSRPQGLKNSLRRAKLPSYFWS